ncbi:MAG: hypothetical protein R3E08_12635 [Thiotrichaceae bacterium]
MHNHQERDELLLLLRQVGTFPIYDLATAHLRTRNPKQQGLKVADAAHLALAEQVSEVLITVDDRFLRFCHRTNTALWCTTPPQFCEQENLMTPTSYLPEEELIQTAMESLLLNALGPVEALRFVNLLRPSDWNR